MARQNITLPHHHRRIPVILATTATVGLIFLLWGLIVLSVWPTLFGGFWTLLFKSWFNDRMVWLYEDMKDVVPEYEHPLDQDNPITPVPLLHSRPKKQSR